MEQAALYIVIWWGIGSRQTQLDPGRKGSLLVNNGTEGRQMLRGQERDMDGWTHCVLLRLDARMKGNSRGKSGCKESSFFGIRDV